MKKVLIFFTIIIIIFLVLESNKWANVEQLAVILDNEDIITQMQDEIIIKNDVIYMSLRDVQNYFDEDLYQEDEKIFLSSDKKIAVLELNKNSMEINFSTIQMTGQAFEEETGKIYLPLSDLQSVYNIELFYNQKYNNIVIDYYSKGRQKAEVTKNITLRQKPRIISSKVEQLPENDAVIYISDVNRWAKVRTQNGNIGYIKKQYLTNIITERDNWEEEQKQELSDISYKKDITGKKIEKYNDRKNIIENILVEAIEKEEKAVKIAYNNQEQEAFKKFKLEATAILKECGITVIFDE